MEKIKRFIVVRKEDEKEMINEYGFFRFEYEAKRMIEILGEDYYWKVYWL